MSIDENERDWHALHYATGLLIGLGHKYGVVDQVIYYDDVRIQIETGLRGPRNDPEPREKNFWWLVREAHQAIEAVDKFDLNSQDPASVKEFNRLSAEARRAHDALCDFIKERDHGEGTEVR